MILDHSGLFLDRFQSASNGPGMPFVKVTPGPSRIAIVPEVTEEFLDGPGSRYLQVGLFEFAELLGEDFIEILFVDQPAILGACQTPISGFLTSPNAPSTAESVGSIPSRSRLGEGPVSPRRTGPVSVAGSRPPWIVMPVRRCAH